MKALIVYDSLYGNTEQVAKAIGGAMAGAKVLRAGEANPSELNGIDLLIVGSPTQGGRNTQAIRAFLDKIPASSLKGMKVAAFDTRLSTKWVGVFGYAAGRIASDLKAKGANLIALPEAFFVTGTKGPLKDGESERAAGWLREIVKGLP
ncbi:MAG TPA: flavodoxin family protein [Dehalococcoidales bacterium]|nr:flavodoxin family protein [Dehalococcoidales bacterium]